MQQLVSKIPMFRVLRIRSFSLLWTAQLLTYVVSNMLLFVLGILVYSQTRLNTHVSMLYLAIGLPATILGLMSGLIVDSFDKKKILLSTTLIKTVILIFIYFQHGYLPGLFIAAGIFSVVGLFFIPAEASLIPRLVPPNLLFAANSLFTMTFYASIIGGFVLGGPLYGLLGKDLVIGLFIFLHLMIFIILMMLPSKMDESLNGKKITFTGLFIDLKFAVSFIKDTSFVSRALLLSTILQVVVTIFMILGPGFADKILMIKLTDASVVLLGPAAVGMIFGALSMGVIGHKVAKRTLIFSGVLISGVLLTVLSGYIKFGLNAEIINPDWADIKNTLLPVTVGLMFFLGICVSLIDVSCNTILQERTSDEVRGRVYGVLSTMISGVSLLPVVISGVLADILGIEQIILFIGIILLLFGYYVRKKYPVSD